MIPMNKLEVGARYRGIGRNFSVGTWDGKEFRGMRRKFHMEFEDGELHWDEGPPHGTFKPLEKVIEE